MHKAVYHIYYTIIHICFFRKRRKLEKALNKAEAEITNLTVKLAPTQKGRVLLCFKMSEPSEILEAVFA